MTKVLENGAEKAQACRQSVATLQKHLKTAERLLKELASEELLKNPARLKVCLGKLAKLDLQLPELEPLLKEMQAFQKEQERQLPLQFGRDLKEAAEKADIAFRVETSEPPSFRLTPLTVEPNFKKGESELLYARLPVGKTSLDPADILAARQKYVTSLEGGASPEDFLEKLYLAYRKACAGAGKRPGERVDLAELLPDLALALQPKKFLANPTKDNYTPYGRVRLAYDLARLKREGLFEYQGKRLSLGTATIGTTRQKDKVLYLEGPGGKGQYYLSIAFGGAR